MPFGLTNAPASFQSWMNHIFKPLFRNCVLVFFDDILIYNPTLKQHVHNLRVVFELMKLHTLYDKRSKCSFVVPIVKDLSHFISGKGVETDSQKVRVVKKWPVPKNVK